MSRFSGFVAKRRRGITYIIIAIVCILLMFFTNKSAVVTGKKIVFSFAYPFQVTFSSIGKFFGNTINSISRLQKMESEFKQTQTELEQYKKVIIDFNELNNEISSLRKLLDLSESVDYELVACEVVGRDPARMNETLIINKGTVKGVRENMPVISYAGGKKTLIGKISEATPFASKVMTLNNPQMSIGAMIVKNRVNCLVKGNNDSNSVVNLIYIPKEYTEEELMDAFVYTSGDSLIFPKGLEIGRITGVKQSERFENFNEATVRLTAELAKVEYLLVLKTDYRKDDFKLMDYPEDTKK